MQVVLARRFCLQLTFFAQRGHVVFAVALLLSVLFVAWTTVDLAKTHASAAKREVDSSFLDANTALALSLLANVPARMVEADEKRPGLRW